MAKILFTREKLDQKVVAKRVKVSEKTMSEWVNKFNWKDLRNRLLLTKEEQINSMFEQLEALNEEIKKSATRRPDSKQADVQIKLSTAIRNLETDLSIAELVESGIRFIRFVQRIGTLEQTMDVTDLWNSFIQENLKK